MNVKNIIILAENVTAKCFHVAKNIVLKGMALAGSYVGELASSYEAKRKASDIQAQGYLSNLQRQALREPPIIYLDSVQENAILPPEFCGMNTYIKLNNDQAEQVFQHMLKQHALDAESREELADTVTPLVGIPNMVQPIFKVHKLVATIWILNTLNDIRSEKGLKPISYNDIVGSPLFSGTNIDIRLVYNMQTTKICGFVYGKYKENGKYLNDVRLSLKDAGVEIKDVETNGAFLEVTIKWTGA